MTTVRNGLRITGGQYCSPKTSKLFIVKIGSECFGEIVDSACRKNFIFVQVFGGVNLYPQMQCN